MDRRLGARERESWGKEGNVPGRTKNICKGLEVRSN